MATGEAGRRWMSPLLVVNLAMYIIVLGLAGWSLDKYINGQNHHHLRGNAATNYLLVFSLLAAVIGACSVFSGLMHLRAWHSDSLAGAASTALVSWAFTALSFGVACKEISLGNRGRRLETLEAFIIILTVTQLMYVGLLHAGFFNNRYGPAYRDTGTEYTGMTHDPQKPATTAVV